MRYRSRAKRFLGNASVLILTVAILFAAGELVMRILYPPPEFSGRLWRREWNGDYRLSVFIPGTHVVYAGVPTTINSLGLRNREIDLEKGEHTARILVFGDSFTFGDGLATDDTLPSRLEALMPAEAPDGERFEVINFGVSGMNTFQEVMYALNYGLLFDPDVIIIVWVYNDIELNGYSLDDLVYFIENRTLPRSGETGENGTRHEGGGEGMSLRPWRLYERIRSRSLFITFLGTRTKELLGRLGVNVKMSEEMIYSDLDSEGFTLCFESLTYINRELLRRGIEFHTVLYPPLQRLDEEYYNRLINKKVEDFCVNNGIRCINLFESFRGQNPAELHVSKMDHHPNRYANGIASEAIADHLRRTSRLFEKTGGM